MQEPVDEARLRAFMRGVGRAGRAGTRVYFTGGATAVLLGWRTSTVDVDLKIVPDSDEVFGALPALKEELRLNVELAAPSDFIPELPEWDRRCLDIGREGAVDFLHYDLYAQALAKVERGHAQDRKDVHEMLARGLVEPEMLRALFDAIEPRFVRYPHLDPTAFRRALEETLRRELGA